MVKYEFRSAVHVPSGSVGLRVTSVTPGHVRPCFRKSACRLHTKNCRPCKLLSVGAITVHGLAFGSSAAVARSPVAASFCASAICWAVISLATASRFWLPPDRVRGRKIEPHVSLYQIMRHTAAIAIQDSQVVLGWRKALVGTDRRAHRQERIIAPWSGRLLRVLRFLLRRWIEP